MTEMPFLLEKRMISHRQYGTIIMARGICSDCGSKCLIVKGNLSSCCHAKVKELEKGTLSKEANLIKRRSLLSKEVKAKILEIQNNKCYWCGKAFGDYIVSKNLKIQELKPYWDHYIPFAYTSSSEIDQFVASCRLCNSWKAAKMITKIGDEAIMKEYIKRKWASSIWELL